MDEALPSFLSRLHVVSRPQTRSLATLRRGQRAQVVAVREAGSLGERLMEMGLTPGTLIRLVRTGFLGDPLQLELRGYMLSLRRAQAQHIDVMSVL